MFFFVVCVLRLDLASAQTSRKGIVTIVDSAIWSYGAQMAIGYGQTLDSSLYSANLMLPPGDDLQMCEFPEDLADWVQSTEDYSNTTGSISAPPLFGTPVALLVSLGGCSLYTKAAIAAEIRQTVTSSLRFVILYNNDPIDSEAIVPIKPPPQYFDDQYADYSNDNNATAGTLTSPTSELEKTIDSLVFLSMSTSNGNALISRIQLLELRSNGESDASFLSPNNLRWKLPMILEVLSDDRYWYNGGYDSGRSFGAGGNFVWFRFILFTLLIVSPCCRTGYLWWAGGGRIRLRRNEQGRIVGFQYIPPISYWFATGTGPANTDPNAAAITDRLTESQVLALPEITYRMPEGETSDNDSTSPGPPEETSKLSDTSHMEDEIRVTLTSSTQDETDEEKIDESTSVKVSIIPSTQSEDDEERQTTTIISLPVLTTSCTTCSICIDEFEEGERIRLLPRCKHGFHTECIVPWLTERQGCCPLCKTPVVRQEGEEDDVQEEAVENNNNATNEAGSAVPNPETVPESDLCAPSGVPVLSVEPGEELGDHSSNRKTAGAEES